MYPSVVKVIPNPDFTLLLGFDNGEGGILDIKPCLDFGVFSRLKDPALFNQVRVAFDTVEWECGVDLDPEFVYSKARSVSHWKP
jgi:hypothetical protein